MNRAAPRANDSNQPKVVDFFNLFHKIDVSLFFEAGSISRPAVTARNPGSQNQDGGIPGGNGGVPLPTVQSGWEKEG